MDRLLHISWVDWVLLSLLSNLLLLCTSVGFYLFWERISLSKPFQAGLRTVLVTDIQQTVITILCNSLIMLLGVWLWREGAIQLDDRVSFGRIALQIICLLLLMDFCMYIFHRIAHVPQVYRFLHSTHHQHVRTNCLSLFVLHPLESLGFGCMFTLLLVLFSFSPLTIFIYLLINMAFGTIGHLNKEFFPDQFFKIGIGTSRFHNDHHLDEKVNFGFYTTIWDRIFGTFKYVNVDNK